MYRLQDEYIRRLKASLEDTLILSETERMQRALHISSHIAQKERGQEADGTRTKQADNVRQGVERSTLGAQAAIEDIFTQRCKRELNPRTGAEERQREFEARRQETEEEIARDHHWSDQEYSDTERLRSHRDEAEADYNDRQRRAVEEAQTAIQRSQAERAQREIAVARLEPSEIVVSRSYLPAPPTSAEYATSHQPHPLLTPSPPVTLEELVVLNNFLINFDKRIASGEYYDAGIPLPAAAVSASISMPVPSPPAPTAPYANTIPHAAAALGAAGLGIRPQPTRNEPSPNIPLRRRPQSRPETNPALSAPPQAPQPQM